MTNREAIVWLKSTKEHYGEYHEKADEALDIAIKGLEFINENFPESFKDYLNGIPYGE